MSSIAFLIVSELSVFRAYFDRNWPLLGEDSGFVTLGATMVLLGISTLGELNNQSTRQKEIGLPFWKLILGAGVVSIVIGTLNIGLVCTPSIFIDVIGSSLTPIDTELCISRSRYRNLCTSCSCPRSCCYARSGHSQGQLQIFQALAQSLPEHLQVFIHHSTDRLNST